MHQERAVSLEHEQAHGLGEPSRKPTCVQHFAASDEKAHARRPYCPFRTGGALGAQCHQSALDAIPRVGIVDLLGDGGRTRPEVCRLRVRTKRRRTVRSLLEALERPLEVPTAREVKGEQLELVVQRVPEGLLVGSAHEEVKLASARSGQR